MIDPGSLAGAMIVLVLASLLLWLAFRVKDRARFFALGAASLLLVRVVLIHNPWCWDAYGGVLGARDVGWRQRDVIRVERDRFLKKPESLDYLVVGSSQADAIFREYAASHQELEIFAMAGLFPLDFLLYREYIAAHRPGVVLLHLSEFDMARVHSPRRAVMAPSQGLSLPRLYLQLRAFPQGRDYDRAVVEMAVGEIFPEFRFGFVFRGLVDKGLGRREALQEESPEPMLEGSDPDPEELQQQITGLANRIEPDSLEFNFFFLEEFLDFCADRGIAVMIIEGQYMPAARAATDQRANTMVRDRLQALSADREGVAFVPRDAVFEFTDAQYVDVAHVEPEAGYDFTRRLLDYLRSR
jgi:hypothetical protein